MVGGNGAAITEGRGDPGVVGVVERDRGGREPGGTIIPGPIPGPKPGPGGPYGLAMMCDWVGGWMIIGCPGC